MLTTFPAVAGSIGVGAIALTGDVAATIAAFKAAAPLLIVPTKAAVAFPIVYHYVAGLRHIAWDKHTIGKQADKSSLLERTAVDSSSRFIIGTSIAATLGLALYSI